MKRLYPEEIERNFDNFINYCDSCCAMEYQPHCNVCDCFEYPKEVSIFDEDRISVLLDSYYSCLVTSEKVGHITYSAPLYDIGE